MPACMVRPPHWSILDSSWCLCRWTNWMITGIICCEIFQTIRRKGERCNLSLFAYTAPWILIWMLYVHHHACMFFLLSSHINIVNSDMPAKAMKGMHSGNPTWLSTGSQSLALAARMLVLRGLWSQQFLQACTCLGKFMVLSLLPQLLAHVPRQQ